MFIVDPKLRLLCSMGRGWVCTCWKRDRTNRVPAVMLCLPILLVAVLHSPSRVYSQVSGGSQTSEAAQGRKVDRAITGQAVAMRPDPLLLPTDVVRAQLEALRLNELDNRGIARCFEFAAPSNRLVTGPLQKFIEMVNSPRYEVLLNHRRALLGRPEMNDAYAYVVATVADRHKRLWVFGFSLARQTAAPYEGCWMTTGVERILISRNNPGSAATMTIPAVVGGPTK